MLEQKHGPGKRIPAAQRYRQRLALGRGQARGQHPPQHSRRVCKPTMRTMPTGV